MSNISQLKKENVLKILQSVKGAEGISKPEIAQLSGLTATTVQNIIGELEGRGVVKSEGFSVSNGGRKALKYALNRGYRYIVGVYLRTNKITVGVFDYLIGPVAAKTRRQSLGEGSVEETVRDIAKLIAAALEEAGVPAQKVAGVGVSVPGPVDFAGGRVITLRGYRSWKNIKLAAWLGELTGLPTFVDKDVNAGAIYLKWLRRAGERPNMLYLSVEDGIGAGIMIGGQVYRGNHGVAGEIGHTTVQENGQRCACGNVGCLELVSSDFAIIDKTRRLLGLPPEQELGIEEVIARSNAGDARVEGVLAGATSYLATTIRNTFMLYDPDEIFINCRWLFVKKKLFFQLIDSLYDDNTLIDRGDIHISLIDIADFGLKSAAAIVAAQELESSASTVFAGAPAT